VPSPKYPAKLREAEGLLEMASLITKRTETAAGSTMNPSQRTRTEMGTDMYQVETIGTTGKTEPTCHGVTF